MHFIRWWLQRKEKSAITNKFELNVDFYVCKCLPLPSLHRANTSPCSLWALNRPHSPFPPRQSANVSSRFYFFYFCYVNVALGMNLNGVTFFILVLKLYFLIFIILLLFNYNCLRFLPTTPPDPSYPHFLFFKSVSQFC